MNKLSPLFEKIYESSSKQRSERIFSAMDSSRHIALEKSASLSLLNGPQEELVLQSIIRPYFGKLGLNHTAIGTHPDFYNLESDVDEIINHYICTFFVDIKGSTRLTLLYDLNTVFHFKNAVIKTCIEVIRSFDGYIHRIMGDAVMAFFGGKNISKEDAIANALNCSVVLRSILEQSIKPWLQNQNMDGKDFGFRIGCDFGNTEQVAWGNFGYENVSEVSAVGFPVDIASKLQGLSGKNQTMLGQGLLNFIDWPDDFSQIKQYRDGEKTLQQPFVTPNYTDENGYPINYKMRLLDFSKCIEFSSLPTDIKASLSSKIVHHNSIKFSCSYENYGKWLPYHSASFFLEKNVPLQFGVQAGTNSRLNFPLTVKFTKTNYGQEAEKKDAAGVHNPTTRHLRLIKSGGFDKSPSLFSDLTLDEYTSYRGTHTMQCEVFDSNNILQFRDIIAVMIK